MGYKVKGYISQSFIELIERDNKIARENKPGIIYIKTAFINDGGVLLSSILSDLAFICDSFLCLNR